MAHGVRTKDFKLIHYYTDIDEWELFDLNEDPREMHNVYNHPQYGAQQEKLHKLLQELRGKYHDSDSI